jgi:hypothetical protein
MLSELFVDTKEIDLCQNTRLAKCCDIYRDSRNEPVKFLGFTSTDADKPLFLVSRRC